MKLRHVLFLVYFVLLQGQVWGQTPGMIIKPASGGGAAVLDPNGDGYVSQPTNGVQLGFTNPPNNDVAQSELPYVDMDRADPIADLLRGPTGAFSEIIGVDAAGNNAIMWYSDGTNLLFRFRIDNFAPNSKSYSILLDTDSKFGFTGPNADPNAVTGNPGFEVEIVLETNFNVQVYNIDGVTAGTLVASFSYDTNSQKSIAVTYTSGNPDYFYDFFIPYSAVATLFTPTTPLRHIALTSMNPQPAMGNNAQSDVAGVGSTGSLDQLFIDHLTSETPTTPGGSVLDRSACPAINPVGTSSTTISGTSTEVSGTAITVKVYQSDGVTLIGSGTTNTSGTTWSINVSALSPSVTLANGQVVKATATAPQKGMSSDNCNPQTVTGCAGTTSYSNVVLTPISGSKGYSVGYNFSGGYPAGTIITWYNADYTLAVYPDKNGSSTNIPNPVTTSVANQVITFSTQTGQTFPNGQYYFTFQEPGKCVSSYLSDCQYSTSGASTAPVITTTPITRFTTTVSGSCASTTGTVVSLYANGTFLKSTTVAGTTSWTISGLNLSSYDCGTITASAADPTKCPTNSVSGVAVSHVATKPTIQTSGCLPASPTSISGYSNELDGAIVTLYKTNPTRTSLGTATVTSGAWSVGSLTLASGDNLVAAVTGGSCVTAGPDSDPITISTQTSLSAYTISITAPTEGQSSVGGTISGGSYPVTLKLYIDQSQIGSGITVSGPGSWSVGGLLSTDLYIGGTIQVTLTSGGGCESPLSSASATVQCLQPATPTYTGGSVSYCLGGAGHISINTSEALAIYQLVDGSGTAVGPSYVGTGSAITLYTNALNANLGPVYVKAFKLANPSCNVTASTAINFDTPSPTPTVTFSNTSLTVAKGTTSVNLPFTAKSVTPSADTYTISYTIAAKAQGFADVTTSTAIPAAPGNVALVVPASPAVGSYSGTLTVANSSGATCTSSYGFTITVYDPVSTPVISVQPANVSICEGNATTLSVTAVNATGYQWQSATAAYTGPFADISGATSSSYTTPVLSSKVYYRVVVSNSHGSVTSDPASVFVTAKPVAGAITGSTAVCTGTAGNYSISAVTGATSYTWSYSGSNVTITGSSTAVTLTFAANATSGTLSVTANNSCGSGTAASLSITVTQTPAVNNLTVNACSGAAFSVTPANVTNGTVPAGTTYSWSAPTVTGSMTGGATGSGASAIGGTLTNPTSTTQTATYTVTPVSGGCSGSSFTVTVSVNPPIQPTLTTANLACNGVSTGSIGLAVSGGTPGYTYSWTGPSSFSATTQNLSGLAAGTYNLTVTDSKNCTAASSATITQPTALSVTPTVTDVACNGGTTGAISLAVSGGTGTITYLWNDGASTQNRTGLAAGTYSVTVTDANACTKTQSGIVVGQPVAISASASATAISCNGGTSTITVTASGGNGTLTYSLNGGAYQSGNTFSGITASASAYNITVKDAGGCTQTTSVTVTQPAVLALSTALTMESCPGKNDGAIALTVSGGTPGTGYTYNWGGGVTTQNRTGLAAGTYSVTVTDANGCTASATAVITDLSPNPVTPGAITK